MQVFTIGHSTRSIAELLELLRAHGVRTLVDVRSIRRSRTNPQFDEAALRAALGRLYVVIPELGGRRGKPARPPRLANDAWEHQSSLRDGHEGWTSKRSDRLRRSRGSVSRIAVSLASSRSIA